MEEIICDTNKFNTDNFLTMKEIPESERPYERLLFKGPKALSNQEILAIIIGSGTKEMNALQTASLLLSRFEINNLSKLKDISIEELMLIKGIGMNKAIRIKAALELNNRIIDQPLTRNLDFSSPSSIVKHYQNYMENLDREELKGLFLNIKNFLIKDITISTGGLNSTIVYPRDVFKEAIKANAANVILMHNHPSGITTPSMNDINTTAKFIEIGKLLGIKILDHIIIGKKNFLSIASDNNYSYLFN